jgi:transcriptional regulator with XRE-family HTH domain
MKGVMAAKVGRPRVCTPHVRGSLAGVLREKRAEAGMTRAEVAARANLSVNTLMAVEQGRAHDPGFFKVAALCSALSLSLDELRQAIRTPPLEGSVMTNGIVSIGYEGRTIEDFVTTLVAHGVGTVADVRLNPISRKPGFSKTKLTNALAEAGIEYRHWKSLGNPKANREPFWTGRAAEGQAMFRGLLRNKQSDEALTELTQLAGNQVVAVLCFEEDQRNCHRQVVIDEVTGRLPMAVVPLVR